MSFFDLLDGLLTTLDVPFYEGQPEFEGDPPAAFISYSVYDVPKLFGCGKEMVTSYYVTINIYTTGTDKATVAELAEMYNMSEGHFIRQFKSFTGYTPLEYRSRKVVENAKSLLSGTDMPITDISESLGFEDPLYFSRVFKKNAGMSPREYRKKFI